MKVEDYRLQDYDIVQFKNGIISLYYEYDFIIHDDLLRSVNRKHDYPLRHTYFNTPSYTGKNIIDDLTVTKVKHSKNSLINMEVVLNIFEKHDIDWDIEFD